MLENQKTTHRLDTLALWNALDDKRVSQGLSWRAVADAVGVVPSTFSRMRDPQTGMTSSALVSMLAWLGMLDCVWTFVQENTVPQEQRWVLCQGNLRELYDRIERSKIHWGPSAVGLNVIDGLSVWVGESRVHVAFGDMIVQEPSGRIRVVAAEECVDSQSEGQVS